MDTARIDYSRSVSQQVAEITSCSSPEADPQASET
jgi:hypothetical protein